MLNRFKEVFHQPNFLSFVGFCTETNPQSAFKALDILNEIYSYYYNYFIVKSSNQFESRRCTKYIILYTKYMS